MQKNFCLISEIVSFTNQIMCTVFKQWEAPCVSVRGFRVWLPLRDPTTLSLDINIKPDITWRIIDGYPDDARYENRIIYYELTNAITNNTWNVGIIIHILEMRTHIDLHINAYTLS